MKKDNEAIVVGGGLTGPSLALALASGGIPVTVLDGASGREMADPEFDGRAYALSLSSVQFFRALGLWREIADFVQPIEDIRISDGRVGTMPGPWSLHFSSAELDQGPMGCIVEDRFVRRFLLDAVSSNPLITYRTSSTVVAQSADPGKVSVTLSSGESLGSKVLVGCDGRESGVARRAGISRMHSDYRQSSLVCAVEHEKPHNAVACQLFLPAGPLAILPLTGNRSSVVWTETRERAAAISRLDVPGYTAELRQRFGSFLGEIKLLGKRYSYPLSLTLATDFTAQRVALAGDAAHGIHPLAGQGLNLGLRDVAALAEVLVGAVRLGEDSGSQMVLDRYHIWRRFDTASLVLSTDMINRLFSNDNPFLRFGRDLGLALTNNFPALRRTLISEAAGLSGDLPALLSGRAI